MRTTVTIEGELLTRASDLTGIKERSALMREGLETLVRVESARRLAALGGSDRDADAAPRRRGAADVHLLGSVALVGGGCLWTRDEWLLLACRDAGVSHVEEG